MLWFAFSTRRLVGFGLDLVGASPPSSPFFISPILECSVRYFSSKVLCKLPDWSSMEESGAASYASRLERSMDESMGIWAFVFVLGLSTLQYCFFVSTFFLFCNFLYSIFYLLLHTFVLSYSPLPCVQCPIFEFHCPILGHLVWDNIGSRCERQSEEERREEQRSRPDRREPPWGVFFPAAPLWVGMGTYLAEAGNPEPSYRYDLQPTGRMCNTLVHPPPFCGSTPGPPRGASAPFPGLFGPLPPHKSATSSCERMPTDDMRAMSG